MTGIITQKAGGPEVDQTYNFLQFMVDERISSGLPRLDSMLHGGYHRGSNVLLSGAPGTAKSTLAGLFAAVACARGERTLYVSFDEGAAQIVRNLRSVGIQLATHQRSGLLKIYSTRTRGPNIEDQFGALRRKVRPYQPRCLVIDPLSALSTKMQHLASADAAQQFLDFLKGEGITVVNTSLMDGLSTDEATATGISTIADTWIHVSYVVQDGERNRALTIVKSRGTGHSNQVRELRLSDAGVTYRRLRRPGKGAHGRGPLGVGTGGASDQGAFRGGYRPQTTAAATGSG
jgi:circadian clock protein KaiC